MLPSVSVAYGEENNTTDENYGSKSTYYSTNNCANFQVQGIAIINTGVGANFSMKMIWMHGMGLMYIQGSQRAPSKLQKAPVLPW